MTQPFFSVIVLFWNGERYLARLLQSLDDQAYTDFEVILLDNGAESPPEQSILARHPTLNIRQIKSEVNLGFAAGNNLAVRHANGEYLAFLNGDAFPTVTWLETIAAAIPNHPDYFFASRLINANNTQLLDGEWNVVHASGLVLRRNHNRPVSSSATEDREVMSACAAASVHPKAAFEAVGGFDEDFFAYMEDVDLDTRMQLAGYRCLYLPHAVVDHVGTGSTGPSCDLWPDYGPRNLIWNFVKNMPGVLFYLLLPVHIIFNLLYVAAALFMPNGKALLRGKTDALRKLPEMIGKRRFIQSQRKTSILRFATLLDWNPLTPLKKLKH